MIKVDEDALICDLAETYHIYDYKELPLTTVACFAAGLRDDSRIKMKSGNQKVPLNTLFLAGISDRLGLLLWSKTKDGQKGTNKPTMILDSLTSTSKSEKGKNNNVIIFNSGEDFEKTRNEILKDGGRYGN